MAWTQAKHYHHEVMLHAANECRMCFTVGSFPGGEAVQTVEMGGGERREGNFGKFIMYKQTTVGTQSQLYLIKDIITNT